MKNTFQLIGLFIVLSFCGCTTSNVLDNQDEHDVNLQSRNPCPEGFKMEITVEFKKTIFAKFDGLACKKGFGFCFSFGPVIKFDCVRLTQMNPLERVFYDATADEGVLEIIKNSDNRTYIFYFDSAITSISDFSFNDFNYLSIGPNLIIDGSEVLIPGNYPKIIEGNLIKYIVPYAN